MNITRVLAGATATLTLIFAGTAPAIAAQALPPRCTVEPSGYNAVTGTCPAGFYWTTVECRDVRFPFQNWHQWGDATDRPTMTATCKPWQYRTGGQVHNITTGEKIRL